MPPGANSYNVYKGKNGVYGFIGRAGDGATGFTDTTVAPDTSDTPPEDKNPFDAAQKYPGCSTYHEGRQWYARTNQQAADALQLGLGRLQQHEHQLAVEGQRRHHPHRSPAAR